MDCTNCGAPLPPKSNVCKYCRTLNETDLRTARTAATKLGTSPRDCPRCETVRLAALRVTGLDGVKVDRCPQCHGIFFDPGELERVLKRPRRSLSPVDRDELQRLIDEERAFEKKVVYVRCPECRQLMDRRIHGRKSGIVVDRCGKHGVWLDGGELGALLKWAAAGGAEHTATVEAQEKAHAEERAKTRAVIPDRVAAMAAANRPRGHAWRGELPGEGLFSVLELLGDLFD